MSYDIEKRNLQRKRNIEVWRETVKKYKDFVIGESDVYDILPSDEDLHSLKKYDTTVILFEDDDCIDVAIKYKKNGMNPIVLNMCDWSQAGGIVRMGALSQEEECFRRSNYHKYLLQDYYPLDKYIALISRNVEYYRNGAKYDYSLLESSVNLDMYASPAVCYPVKTSRQYDFSSNQRDAELNMKDIIDPDIKTFIINTNNDVNSSDNTGDNTYFKNRDDIDMMENKIRQMVYLCAKNENDCAVFSAWGCGAFDCPPYHVGILFGKVLKEFSGLFKEVVFAIIRDPYKPENYDKMKEGFDSIYNT
jgi:hypothetical protein